MKTIMAVLMLLISTSLLARPSDCVSNPDFPACKVNSQDHIGGVQGLTQHAVSIPEPSTLSLIGLGLAATALVRARKRKR